MKKKTLSLLLALALCLTMLPTAALAEGTPAPQQEPTKQGETAPAQPEPEQEAPEQPQSTEPRCPHCGAAVKMPGAAFCTACGERLDEQ